MGLLITLLIYFLVFGLVYFLIQKAPFIDSSFKQIAGYVLLVVFVIVIISLLAGLGPVPRWV